MSFMTLLVFDATPSATLLADEKDNPQTQKDGRLTSTGHAKASMHARILS